MDVFRESNFVEYLRRIVLFPSKRCRFATHERNDGSRLVLAMALLYFEVEKAT